MLVGLDDSGNQVAALTVNDIDLGLHFLHLTLVVRDVISIASGLEPRRIRYPLRRFANRIYLDRSFSRDVLRDLLDFIADNEDVVIFLLGIASTVPGMHVLDDGDWRDDKFTRFFLLGGEWGDA